MYNVANDSAPRRPNTDNSKILAVSIIFKKIGDCRCCYDARIRPHKPDFDTILSWLMNFQHRAWMCMSGTMNMWDYQRTGLWFLGLPTTPRRKVQHVRIICMLSLSLTTPTAFSLTSFSFCSHRWKFLDHPPRWLARTWTVIGLSQPSSVASLPTENMAKIYGTMIA